MPSKLILVKPDTPHSLRRLVAFAALLVGSWVAAPHLAGAGVEEAVALFEARDYEPAKQIFEESLSKNASDKTALYYMGRIHFAYSDLEGALDYLEKLVKLEPKNAEYHFRLAEVYGDKARTASFFLSKKKWAGKWKEALEGAVELDPLHLDAREWLALYLLHAPGIGGGDKGRGTDIARATIEIDEVFGRLLLAYAYRRTDKLERAIAEYRAVLAIDPDNDRAYRGLGYAYLRKKEFDTAESHFEKSVELAPNDADSYEAMAYFRWKRGQTEALMENQERALALDPLLSDTRYELAVNYQEMDMTAEAMAHYEQLLALTPAHHKAGSARKRLKKIKNAHRR